MVERWHRLRWALLAVALVVLVVFLVAQRQSVDVSYAESPSGRDTVTEGSAGELSGARLPSVDAMKAMVDADPVVRLPGAVAAWDERRVRGAIGGADIRILVAPPGLTEDQQDQVREVDNADILVVGTEVTGSALQASSDDLPGWRGEFATGDVTSQVLALVASQRDQPLPSDVDLLTRRAPTAAELAAVTADLRAGRPHVAAGATLESVPRAAATAFPGGPLVVALPRQPFGRPVPDYGPALEKAFPGKPVVTMYGYWIEYHGPRAGEFADIAAASFYARFGDRVARYAYPQGNVLGAYLNTVTDVRYAGLFDRPLPYQPFDPLRVALPVLPWLFAACVLGFLVLSARSLRGPGSGVPRRPPARLAALTTLAIELSGLSHDAALTRGIGKLRAAGEALDGDLPDRHVQQLLGEAEKELDQAARALGRPDYRPGAYLAGGVS